MYAGKVMEEGATDQIYYNPRHPYTAGLLKSVPSWQIAKTKDCAPLTACRRFVKRSPGCPFVDRCDYRAANLQGTGAAVLPLWREQPGVLLALS